MSDVTEWLASIGLEQHAAAFSENDIEFDLLTRLDHEVLQAIGVKSAGHRMTILKAAQALADKRDEADEPDAPISTRKERNSFLGFC